VKQLSILFLVLIVNCSNSMKMRTIITIGVVAAVVLAVIITVCTATAGSSVSPQPINAVAAITIGTEKSQIKGIIRFTKESDGTVTVVGDIRNLGPNTTHGFHIHELGDVSDETSPCGSTAGHFNPYGKTHGSPTSETRHVGDLGNIDADKDGVASFTIKDSEIALDGPNSVIGRAVVVHADKDDLGLGGSEGSLKTGNAGGRIGCGVVGIAKN